TAWRWSRCRTFSRYSTANPTARTSSTRTCWDKGCMPVLAAPPAPALAARMNEERIHRSYKPNQLEYLRDTNIFKSSRTNAAAPPSLGSGQTGAEGAQHASHRRDRGQRLRAARPEGPDASLARPRLFPADRLSLRVAIGGHDLPGRFRGRERG